MNNVDKLTLSADSFLTAAVIDTSIALDICGVTDGNFDAVKRKIEKLYGTTDVKKSETVSMPAVSFFDKQKYNIVDAVRVIDRLMQKDGGCPWDSVQTHESIRINMIEEAYEAVDAIDKHDVDNMTEEFGDVLLQSLLQSEIARRDGEFDFDDVCDGLCKKLISRHTFIFGGDSASNADDAITLWEKNKAVEKNYATVKDQLERLPDAFPALLLAQKVYKKSKKAGVAADPEAELSDAIFKSDFARVITAAAAMLHERGEDAEVEVNKLVKNYIKSL